MHYGSIVSMCLRLPCTHTSQSQEKLLVLHLFFLILQKEYLFIYLFILIYNANNNYYSLFYFILPSYLLTLKTSGLTDITIFF